MILSAPSFAIIPGETVGQRIARIARGYVGCSLHSRTPDLAALVGRGVNDETWVEVMTNCAVFALGVLSAAGVDCGPATKVGAAFSDLVSMGYRLQAWQASKPTGGYPMGALAWYRLDGKNDDHVEILLGPNAAGVLEHCGGGRPDNAVTLGQGTPELSAGRPLWRWLDPSLLGIDVEEVEPHTDPDPEPHAA